MESEKPSRIPVLASLAFPGAGQFIQGRFIVGTLYALSICVATVMLMVVIIVPIFHNLNAAMSMKEPLQEMSWVKILFWFLIFMAIYVVNMIDAYVAYRNSLSKWMAEKHSAVSEN